MNIASLTAEINNKCNFIEQRMRTALLSETGNVKNWLKSGKRPHPESQLSLALRDASEEEWAAFLKHRRVGGAPIPYFNSSRSAYELKIKWQRILVEIKEQLPQGADLENWVGFTNLAEKMIEMEKENV